MIFIQRKQLGHGWSMEIRHGKRITYGLFLHNHSVKSFWSEKALMQWLKDLPGTPFNDQEKVGA
jgi:hypothetical protein